MKSRNRHDQYALERIVSEGYEVFQSEPQEQEIQIEIDPIEQEEPQESGDSTVQIELSKLAEYSGKLLSQCSGQDLDPWMIAKIAKASEYIGDVYYHIAGADYSNMGGGSIGSEQNLK